MPFGIKLVIAFLVVFCTSIPYLSHAQTHLVKRVIDGDKIQLSNGERVRLIGVDTPETKHPKKPVEYFGKEASAFTKKMVEGKVVTLKYDWQRKDKYGRTLAYVYLKDGTFLNAEIIKQGYGHAYTNLSTLRSLNSTREKPGRIRGVFGLITQLMKIRNLFWRNM